MYPDIKIDKSKCKLCNNCIKVCPVSIPVGKRIKNGLENKNCTKCLLCYASCPNEAVMTRGINTNHVNPQNGRIKIKEKELVDLFANRRSHRKFLDKKVDRSIVEKLVEIAGYIPSGGNSHSYMFSVMEKGKDRKQLLKEIKRYYILLKKLVNNPMTRRMIMMFLDKKAKAFLRDSEYYERISYLIDMIEEGKDPVFYDAPVVIFIHSDSIIPTPKEDSFLAAYNIVLAAESLGLGTCFVSLAQMTVNSNKRCKKILGLEDGQNVNSVLILGHSRENFLRPIPKNPKTVRWIGN